MPRRKISTRVGNTPALPHERDESTDLPSQPRPIIAQAAQDVASGQMDTDNYSRAANASGLMTEKKKRKRQS